MYWLVKENEIIQFYKILPKSYLNISWFDKLTKEELLNYWFYKVIWWSETLQDWQFYWKATYQIWEMEIIEQKEIINIDIEQFKKDKINFLKWYYKFLIEKEYPDYKQRNGALWIYDENYINNMINLIQEKRNEVNEKINNINDADNYEDIILFSNIWDYEFN